MLSSKKAWAMLTLKPRLRLFSPLNPGRLPHSAGKTVLAASALLALAWAPLSHAEGQLPAAQRAGEVQYRCGGIGLDESTAMRAAMKD